MCDKSISEATETETVLYFQTLHIALSSGLDYLFIDLVFPFITGRDLSETIESSPLCITDLFKNKSVLLGAKKTSRVGKSASRVESEYIFSVSVAVFLSLTLLALFPPYSFIWHQRVSSKGLGFMNFCAI